MIHSIIPNEIIFAQDGAPALKTGSVAGIPVLCRELPEGGYQVERILSTNPMDYLKQGILGHRQNKD